MGADKKLRLRRLQKPALQIGLTLSHAALLLSGVITLSTTEAIVVAVPLLVLIVIGAARSENGWRIASWVGTALYSLSLSWPLALVSLMYLHIGKFTDQSLETIGFGMFLVGGPELAAGLLFSELGRYFDCDRGLG